MRPPKMIALTTLLICLLLLAGCPDPSSGTYTVSYDGNGADSGSPPGSLVYPGNSYAVISDNTGNLAKQERHFLHWNTARDDSGTIYNPGEKITLRANMVLYAIWVEGPIFYAQKVTDNLVYAVEAELLATGDSCLVYADKSIRFFKADAEAIRDKFDGEIEPKITGTFGTYKDVDGNRKIILLLLDIVDGFNPSVGGGYVAGYFSPGNMESKSSYAKSNEADMLYIDTSPGWNTSNKEKMYTTVAHEFQHLINYSRSLDRGSEQDLWINEGLSSAAEYIYGGYQDDRITYFNRDRTGSIGKGNNFFVWNGYWETDPSGPGDVLANYSTVYMFFQWLRVHANNGTGIYTDIISSPDGDFNAVTSAASLRINSRFNDWDDLLSTWMWANIKVESGGFEGYKGEPNLKPEWWQINDYYQTPVSSRPLYPGEGVFSVKSPGNTFTYSDTSSIKYSYYSCKPYYYHLFDYTGTYDTYLTVNVNTDKGGSAEPGSVTSNIQEQYARAAGTPFRTIQESNSSGSYPVSFGEKQNEIIRERKGVTGARNASGINRK